MFPIPAGCGPLLRVQVVVARPDDVTSGCGALLRHAARAGAPIAVTCASLGEVELREAARLLGVRHVDVLGFGDPGTEGEPAADTLVGAPFDDVLGAVERSVAAFRPDVLVTLDDASGRRDHRRIRDLTMAVADRRGVPVSLVGSAPPYLRLGELVAAR